MSVEKKDSEKYVGKKKIMITYGVVQLGSNLVSAIALLRKNLEYLIAV